MWAFETLVRHCPYDRWVHHLDLRVHHTSRLRHWQFTRPFVVTNLKANSAVRHGLSPKPWSSFETASPRVIGHTLNCYWPEWNALHDPSRGTTRCQPRTQDKVCCIAMVEPPKSRRVTNHCERWLWATFSGGHLSEAKTTLWVHLLNPDEGTVRLSKSVLSM